MTLLTTEEFQQIPCEKAWSHGTASSNEIMPIWA
jgi:hypothetical protein